MTSNPEFIKTSELLANYGFLHSSSHLHGILAGQLSGGSAVLNLQITQQLLDVHSDFPTIIEELISRMFESINDQLVIDDYSFQPLLPEDDEELCLRLAALGEWCSGFISGFAAAYDKPDQTILEETREILNDLAEIAEIDDNPDDLEIEDELPEENYMEIVEYVRMAVISVYVQNALTNDKASEALENKQLH